MSATDLILLKETCWYALWVRSRHEKRVRDQLAEQEIEPLLPVVKRLSRWKDRRKEVERPLFPGYCFARFAWKDRLTVLRAAGVVQVISVCGRPEPIPDHEIDAIRRLMAAPLPYAAHRYLQEGMRVRIIRGPLEGIEGVLSRQERPHRVVVAVHLIRQAVGVEMDPADLVPLEEIHL